MASKWGTELEVLVKLLPKWGRSRKKQEDAVDRTSSLVGYILVLTVKSGFKRLRNCHLFEYLSACKI